MMVAVIGHSFRAVLVTMKTKAINCRAANGHVIETKLGIAADTGDVLTKAAFGFNR
jgi:hypothetical protein